MKLLKSNILAIAGACALLPVLGSCVHEFPEDEVTPEIVKAPATLHLNFSYEMPPYKDLIYENGTLTSRTTNEDYDARYIIGFYMAADARAAMSRVPDDIQVITRDDIDDLNYDITLEIPTGELTVMVWTDYVKQGSKDDLLYKADDFAKITINQPHVGNTDLRDAFRGCTECVISPEGGEHIYVDMRRPMAKYKFIATDFDLFLSRAEEKARAEAARAGVENLDDISVNLDDYTVKVVYPGFMPNVYNIFTDKPADACTGISFDGKILDLEDGTASLGFDYVLVNGEESLVTVALQIYDKEGQLVSGSPSLNVPLQRSMLTTIRGEFLTCEATGGVGISPDFNGEFNIYIQ